MQRPALRSYRPEDAARFLSLFNQGYHRPIPLDRFLHAEGARDPRLPLVRTLALDGDDLVGAVTLQRTAQHLPGWYGVHLIVDEARRGQGVARRLLDALAPELERVRPVGVEARVLDNDERSRAWAERRGLRVASHSFESTLRLDEFSFSPFAAHVERLEREGTRFVPLATWLAQYGTQALHVLTTSVMLDEPTSGNRAPEPFEVFERAVARSPFTSGTASLVALLGERPVGFTLVRSPREDGVVMVWGTGVARDVRGRGLAAALKALSARAARQEGGVAVRTDNDSRNAGMLRVNRRLGFVPDAGVWRMRGMP